MFTNYINDSAKALDSIMVLDDTYSSIQNLFLIMNKQLQNIVEWFNESKLALNLEKAN